MNAHTPGPWKAVPVNELRGTFAIIHGSSDDCGSIADFFLAKMPLSSPPPWYNATRKQSTQGLIIEEGTGRNVAVSYDPKDADLISAAPDLLLELKAALRIFERDGVKARPEQYRRMREIINRAGGAI